MLALHVYYMEYYRHAVNQVIMTGIITALLASFISATVLTLMLFYGMYDNYVYGVCCSSSLTKCVQSLGLVLLAGCICGILAGVFAANLRVQYMGTMIHEPSGFQRVVYQLQANEVLVPRGEYEVEMAARVMHTVSAMTYVEQETMPMMAQYFRDGNNNNGENSGEQIQRQARQVRTIQMQENRAKSLLKRMGIEPITSETSNASPLAEQLQPDAASRPTGAPTRPTVPPRVLPYDVAVERVDEMYRTALEMVHSNSLYVYICYATFIANILQQYERAVMILTLSETEFQPFMLDLRLMMYLRKKTWLEVVAARRNQGNNNNTASA